jgi:hypothetical protein
VAGLGAAGPAALTRQPLRQVGVTPVQAARRGSATGGGGNSLARCEELRHGSGTAQDWRQWADGGGGSAQLRRPTGRWHVQAGLHHFGTGDRSAAPCRHLHREKNGSELRPRRRKMTTASSPTRAWAWTAAAMALDGVARHWEVGAGRGSVHWSLGRGSMVAARVEHGAVLRREWHEGAGPELIQSFYACAAWRQGITVSLSQREEGERVCTTDEWAPPEFSFLI